MKRLLVLWLRWRLHAALVLLCLLALPSARHFLEISMTRHMLVQFPLLVLIGFCLASGLPQPWAVWMNRWNSYGITGLFATALTLAVLMIPRVLDLALVDIRAELAKWLALVLCGAIVRLSWQRAGFLVQGFFLGNVLPMTAVVGYLFESSPVRVCNAYLLDDQGRLGQGLVWLTIATSILWFSNLVRTLMQKETAVLFCAPGSDSSEFASRS